MEKKLEEKERSLKIFVKLSCVEQFPACEEHSFGLSGGRQLTQEYRVEQRERESLSL